MLYFPGFFKHAVTILCCKERHLFVLGSSQLKLKSFYLFIVILKFKSEMTIHKKEEFGKKKQHLAMSAKAISHPARIAILKILAKKSGCNCNALVEQLPLSQSTVSQHLRELKNAGLIVGSSIGTSIVYSVNKINLKEFDNEFKKMMKYIKKND